MSEQSSLDWQQSCLMRPLALMSALRLIISASGKPLNKMPQASQQVSNAYPTRSSASQQAPTELNKIDNLNNNR